MIKISDLKYKIGEQEILKGLDFKLERGAYLSVIGPNGAGKSTLLKCILRLNTTWQGQIQIDDIDLKNLSQKELARHISYVPQAGGWIPPYTVLEFIRLARYPHLKGTARLKSHDFEMIDEALCLCGLENLKQRSLEKLSGGERQKAYLAAALAQETPIMFLDEPNSFLDPKHVAELDELLKRLNQEQGLSIVTVTHDLNHPLNLKSQVLILKKGKQFYFGPASDMLGEILNEAYEHQFVHFKHPLHDRQAILSQ